MKRLLAVMNRVVKFLEEEHAEVFDLAAPTSAKRRPSKANLLFQFKITLLDSKPPIWRRIQVQDCTLHEHIQTAMGWTNSHLHQFEIKGERYGDPELLENDFEAFDGEDSTRTFLSDILTETGKRFAFKYSPYMKIADISRIFGVGESTAAARTAAIRKVPHLGPLDTDDAETLVAFLRRKVQA